MIVSSAAKLPSINEGDRREKCIGGVLGELRGRQRRRPSLGRRGRILYLETQRPQLSFRCAGPPNPPRLCRQSAVPQEGEPAGFSPTTHRVFKSDRRR